VRVEERVTAGAGEHRHNLLQHRKRQNHEGETQRRTKRTYPLKVSHSLMRPIYVLGAIPVAGRIVASAAERVSSSTPLLVLAPTWGLKVIPVGIAQQTLHIREQDPPIIEGGLWRDVLKSERSENSAD